MNHEDYRIWNHQVYAAIAKWNGIRRHNANFEHCMQLAKLLNDYDPQRATFIIDITKPHTRDLLSKINGPYGDVVLKMLTIKMEERDND